MSLLCPTVVASAYRCVCMRNKFKVEYPDELSTDILSTRISQGSRTQAQEMCHTRFPCRCVAPSADRLSAAYDRRHGGDDLRHRASLAQTLCTMLSPIEHIHDYLWASSRSQLAPVHGTEAGSPCEQVRISLKSTCKCSSVRAPVKRTNPAAPVQHAPHLCSRHI